MSYPGVSGPSLSLWKVQKHIFVLRDSKWSANVPWFMHTVTSGNRSSEWNALLSSRGDGTSIDLMWRTCLWVQSRGQLPPGKCILPSFWAKTWGFLHNKNVFIYSTLAFHGEIESQISHASCITGFSEWLMQVLMQAEGRAVGLVKAQNDGTWDWGHSCMHYYSRYPVPKILKDKRPTFAYCSNSIGFWRLVNKMNSLKWSKPNWSWFSLYSWTYFDDCQSAGNYQAPVFIKCS